MRNKIKQLLKKEEGFTLIELLGVIVILGLIVAISIPLIGNVVENSRTKTNKAQDALIIDAGQLYLIEKGNEEGSVTIEKLKEEKYLETKAISEGDYAISDDWEVVNEKGEYKLNKN